MNILVTGSPGVGKTTLIKALAQDLSGGAGGFYTEEIRRKGQRTGFGIRTLDGKTGTLSGIDIQSPHKVGKYKVDLQDFENIAIPAIEEALAHAKTVVIDEIGPMELFSAKFKDVVLKALDAPCPVIATIKLKGSGFIDRLKSRSDVILYTLTRENYTDILEKIRNKH